MNRYTLAIILSIFFSLSVVPGLGAQEILTVDSYFNTLSATYGEVQDYTADVEITVEKETMKGKLYYKKPNLIRIDFSEPEEQVIAVDGEVLTVYIPAYRVALTQTLRKHSRETIHAMATREGLALMKRNYHIAYLTGPDPVPLEDGSDEMVVKLKLTWRSTEEGFRQLDLSVGEDGMIRRITGITTGYKQIQMDFKNIQTNQNLPDGRFTYDAPPSANMITDFLGFNSEN